jgi:hypothetical protein
MFLRVETSTHHTIYKNKVKKWGEVWDLSYFKVKMVQYIYKKKG